MLLLMLNSLQMNSNCVLDWLERGEVRRLVLVVNSVATKEVLERWDFEIDNTQALQDAINRNKEQARAEGKEETPLHRKYVL